MSFSFIQIFWIVLILISIASLKKILRQKGWTFGNFIRVEDVEEDEK
tara:strand:+ start:6617 stop:6757 length:141 start_codon:yes stop_codon:yes gene_type:complete